MRRSIGTSLLTLALLLLFVIGARDWLESRSRAQQTSQRIQGLFEKLKKQEISSHFRAKRLRQIARLFENAKATHPDLVGMAICPIANARTQAIAFPRGSNWESLCINPHTSPSWAGGPRIHYYSFLLNEKSKGLLIDHVVFATSLPHSNTLGYWSLFALAALCLSYAMQRKITPTQKNSVETLQPKLLTSSPTLEVVSKPAASGPLVVIANREPYIHVHKQGKIELVRPASGLVTALEPVLRQSGGVWIAHGSGTADRETCDANDQIAVPPGNPKYLLKRIWLSENEENGYYYGFSNEGLWPLCHLAHMRPVFRQSDWIAYQNVNAKFANAIQLETLQQGSVILVQDYHFALIPRQLRTRIHSAQGAKIGLFWHIPWPNPETFGICPWGDTLLSGMLGADVIGFHTQYHCNNFLETCNRYLEARIDWERFSVTMENHETRVQAVPIGIDTSPIQKLNERELLELKQRFGIQSKYIAIGVDRLDYTKGLIERFEAVERFLEKYPQFQGEFTLLQVGSPSRTTIPAYRSLSLELRQQADRINNKYSEARARPILFIPEHREWDQIQLIYQLGDVCMVTSLHDGMNLVAKEYIWCQKPERGSLILSKFTGAAREFPEAFIVNPYSIEEMADALAAALSLSPAERVQRMQSMHEKVKARTAHHWANDLIHALQTQPAPASFLSPEGDRKGKLKSVKLA